MTYRRALEWLSEWIPDAKARETILGATALQLFGFDEER